MLEITHISKTFNPGTVNAKLALDDLSLKINDGDFITIIGANGAGKSTLFNAISGNFYVDTGSIVLDGEDITYLPEYKRALPGSHAGHGTGHEYRREPDTGGRKGRMALKDK